MSTEDSHIIRHAMQSSGQTMSTSETSRTDAEEAAYQKWYKEALAVNMLCEVEAWSAGAAFVRSTELAAKPAPASPEGLREAVMDCFSRYFAMPYVDRSETRLQSEILTAIAPFVGDGKDGERLDWLLKQAYHGPAFNFRETVGLLVSGIPVSSVRAAIDAARTAQPATGEGAV